MTGLVSISFRGLTPEELLTAAAAAGLESVEWGGDVHVPAKDTATAAQVRILTREADICAYSYGSYYKIGATPEEEFAGVLASADALGTDIIRTWAYNKGSQEVTDAEYRAAVADARRICDLAEGKTICLECHNFTLTDEYHAALRFVRDVDRENFASYWQPNQYRDTAYNLAACEALAPLTRAVHVFSWDGDIRLPLVAQEKEWRQYIDIIRRHAPDVPFMLEFMHDDRVETLLETAEVLKGWL